MLSLCLDYFAVIFQKQSPEIIVQPFLPLATSQDFLRNRSLLGLNSAPAQDVNSWSDSIWVGAQRFAKGAPFQWNDGSALDYTNWSKWDPNNYNNNEDCLMVRYFPVITI